MLKPEGLETQEAQKNPELLETGVRKACGQLFETPEPSVVEQAPEEEEYQGGAGLA